jgi:hypothetical protein
VFSINPDTQIIVQRIDDSKLQVQSTDIEDMNSQVPHANQNTPAAQPAEKVNPLFAQPQKGFRKESTKKNKMRV